MSRAFCVRENEKKERDDGFGSGAKQEPFWQRWRGNEKDREKNSMPNSTRNSTTEIDENTLFSSYFFCFPSAFRSTITPETHTWRNASDLPVNHSVSLSSSSCRISLLLFSSPDVWNVCVFLLDDDFSCWLLFLCLPVIPFPCFLLCFVSWHFRSPFPDSQASYAPLILYQSNKVNHGRSEG